MGQHRLPAVSLMLRLVDLPPARPQTYKANRIPRGSLRVIFFLMRDAECDESSRLYL